MPSVSRTFRIPRSLEGENGQDALEIKLYEPSLTGDNLGHKTWVASYLLAKRLPQLHERHLACLHQLQDPTKLDFPRVLELGAGTGLLGLAFSALFPRSLVHLTDLPAILPNLQHNITTNASTIRQAGSRVTAGVLDWSALPPPLPVRDRDREAYEIVLAADSIYSPEHPRLLVDAIALFLRLGGATESGKVIMELPLREKKPPEHEEFRAQMEEKKLKLLEEGTEFGYDDWTDAKGERGRKEVSCWWSVWGWARADCYGEP